MVKFINTVDNIINEVINGSIFLGSGGGGDRNTALKAMDKIIKYIGNEEIIIDNVTDINNINSNEIIVAGLSGWTTSTTILPENDIGLENLVKIMKNLITIFLNNYNKDDIDKIKYVIPVETGAFNLLFVILLVAVIKKLKILPKLMILDYATIERSIPKLIMTKLNHDETSFLNYVSCCLYPENINNYSGKTNITFQSLQVNKFDGIIDDLINQYNENNYFNKYVGALYCCNVDNLKDKVVNGVFQKSYLINKHLTSNIDNFIENINKDNSIIEDQNNKYYKLIESCYLDAKKSISGKLVLRNNSGKIVIIKYFKESLKYECSNDPPEYDNIYIINFLTIINKSGIEDGNNILEPVTIYDIENQRYKNLYLIKIKQNFKNEFLKNVYLNEVDTLANNN